jgi:hypothetical protein
VAVRPGLLSSMNRAVMGWKLTISPWRWCGTRAKDDGGHRFWTAATAARPSGSTPIGPASTDGASPCKAARSARAPRPAVMRPIDAVSRVLAELLS